MNRTLITTAYLVFILAGCGDKSDSATGSAEPSMMDSSSEVVEGAGDMASDAVDATKETAQDAAQDVSDATASDAEDIETKEGMDNMDKEEALEYMDKEMGKASESIGQ